MHDLIRAWAEFKLDDPPYLLPGDEVLLGSPGSVITQTSWSDYAARSDFGASDSRFHLSLIPVPFAGNITSAPVIVLMLNPGLSPCDYYAEFHIEEYRRALIANLSQTPADGDFPNLFLNPLFSWHPGFRYWHGKLSGLIEEFAARTSISRRDALSFFSRSFAVLELVPYHSSTFKLRRKVVDRLRSVMLARRFVTDELKPRAASGETLVVVTRKAKIWGLEEGPNTVVYRSHEARGASLTPSSRGGSAILKKLLAAVR